MTIARVLGSLTFMDDTATPDEVPTSPRPETPDEVRARARRCFDEIASILQRHGCRIVAQITPPERVGDDQSGVLLRAVWGVVPLA